MRTAVHFCYLKLFGLINFRRRSKKDDCLKLDWFSSDSDKPEKLSSHLKSYAYAEQSSHWIDSRIPADIRFE